MSGACILRGPRQAAMRDSLMIVISIVLMVAILLAKLGHCLFADGLLLLQRHKLYIILKR